MEYHNRQPDEGINVARVNSAAHFLKLALSGIALVVLVVVGLNFSGAFLARKVPLKSGGHVVIEQTEAMITVDVNTGGYLGAHSLEETVYRTNLEAAQVVPRQLRLRNLGGIIVIDFIDMEEEEHQRQVLRALEKACEGDPAKIRIEGFSSLGLVQMSRKRTRPTTLAPTSYSQRRRPGSASRSPSSRPGRISTTRIIGPASACSVPTSGATT